MIKSLLRASSELNAASRQLFCSNEAAAQRVKVMNTSRYLRVHTMISWVVNMDEIRLTAMIYNEMTIKHVMDPSCILELNILSSQILSHSFLGIDGITLHLDWRCCFSRTTWRFPTQTDKDIITGMSAAIDLVQKLQKSNLYPSMRSDLVGTLQNTWITHINVWKAGKKNTPVN